MKLIAEYENEVRLNVKLGKHLGFVIGYLNKLYYQYDKN